MTPSNLSIILGISVFLLVPPATTGAEELAAPAELAELASREQRLRAKVDDQLRPRVDAATQDVSDAIAVNMTELLERLFFRGAAQGSPPAKQALADGQPTTRVQQAGETACTRVDDTLVCVLREVASR